MTINTASLFLTSQAGAKTPGQGHGQALGLGTGGLLNAASGVNIMDMIFSRLLQETITGHPISSDNPNKEITVDDKNILSMLTPVVQDRNELSQEKKGYVQLGGILHKIAHEAILTLPASDEKAIADSADTPQEMLADDQITGEELTPVPAILHEELPTSTDEMPDPEPGTAMPGRKPKLQDFMTFLNSLLQGIPQESRPVVLKIVPGILNKAVRNLEFDPAATITVPHSETSATDTGSAQENSQVTAEPALIATGLTPESLTEFMKELSARLENGESFIVGMVKILPPQAKREVIFLPRALVLSGQALTEQQIPQTADINLPITPPLQDNETEATQPLVTADIAEYPENKAQIGTKNLERHEHPLLALLSALQTEIPAEKKAGIEKILPVSPAKKFSDGVGDNHNDLLMPKETMARLNALIMDDALPPLSDLGMPEETGFARVLKMLEEAQQRSSQSSRDGMPGLNRAVNIIKSMSPALSTFRAHGEFPVMGMAFAAALSGDVFPEGWDWSQFRTSAGQSMTLNNPAMMASSLINQAPHAGTPHPATQIITATITKAAATGENRNITVRLEPPELGRVEVRMEFSRDKTLKTHIIVEKQETYLMLQRDAHILDRALQDSGLDTDGGTSFELTQDGGSFDDGGNNNQRGTSGGGYADTAGDNGKEIIEATMDWYVDPDTGAMRYDILA